MFFHQRLFQEARRVFNRYEAPAARVESPSTSESDPIPQTLGDMLKHFDQKYGEASYKKLIEDQAKILLNKPNLSEEVNLSLWPYQSALDDSVKRYLAHFNTIRQTLIQETTDLKRTYEKAENEITAWTKIELNKLKASLESAKALEKMSTTEIPSLQDKEALEDHFEDYLNALNAHYFNPKITDGNEVDYDFKSREFKQNMATWVQGRMNYLPSSNGTHPNQLEYLKKEIADHYGRYASFDGDSSKISSTDLRVLGDRMRPTDDRMEDFLSMADAEAHTQDYDQFVARMEDHRILNPESWKGSLYTFANQVMKRVETDHAEAAFIAKVNESIEPVDNFRQAKQAFLKKIDQMHEGAKVKETLQFMDSITGRIFEKTLQVEKENLDEFNHNKGFQKAIQRQMDHLLYGAVLPEKERDKTVLHFLQQGRKQREQMLSDTRTRQELLESIAEITKGYPPLFKSEFGPIPNETTHSAILAKPTTYDRAARMQAIIILGNQAQKMVENFDPKAAQESESIQPSKNLEVSFNFEVPADRNMRYYSSIERGGFNFRDLGLKAIKVLGAITLATNYFKGLSDNKNEKNLLIRMAKAAQNVMTNPAFLLAAGGTALAYKAEQDPRYLRWPWLSPDKKQEVRTADLLENIAQKTSHERLKNFTSNSFEWKLMQKMKDRKNVETALNLARNNKKKPGQITRDILVEAQIIDKEKDADIYFNLGDGLGRTRFLFYEYFLNYDDINIKDIKEHVTGSRFIT